MRQLRQLSEGQVGKHGLRPHVAVAVVLGDRDFLAERQVGIQLRPGVFVVARFGRRDDLPGHQVVGGDGDRRLDPDAAGEHGYHQQQHRHRRQALATTSSEILG